MAHLANPWYAYTGFMSWDKDPKEIRRGPFVVNDQPGVDPEVADDVEELWAVVVATVLALGMIVLIFVI